MNTKNNRKIPEFLPVSPGNEVNLLSEREESKDFYNVPTGPVTDTMLKVMGSRGELETLKQRNKQVSHSQEVTVRKSKEKRQIIIDSGNSAVTVELSDIEKLIGNNKPAKKLFVFTSIKIAEQAMSGGDLRRDYIEFPLKELVDTGNYKSLNSARRGFNDAMDVLTSLKVKGKLKKGKKEIEQESLRVLFTGSDIKKSTCYVYLNPRVNWGFVNAFFTIMPRYCFALPNRAFDLLYYIFYLARQNTKAIKDKGYFTISMRAVQMRLGLPSEKGNANPDRTIKEPIEKAIEEIEDLNGNYNFTITPIYDSDKSILDFLDRGFLEIRMHEEFAKYFIELSQKQEKKIETYQKRQQAIVDKAKEKALVKKLESENTDKKED